MISIKKFINLKTKYGLEFMLKTFVVLSVITSLFYIFKLCGFTNADNIMMFCLISAIVLCFIKNKECVGLKTITYFIFSILIFFVFYICLHEKIIHFLAEKCESSGVKFSFFNTIYNTFGITDFESLIYHTSYGGTKFINGKIITGAIDIFREKKGLEVSSEFLCGKYLSLFASFGITLSLKDNKAELLIINVFALITGNLNIYLLTLLIFYTPYYFLFLLFNFISYFTSNILEINSGFYCNGSIFELILQKDNLIYIFALGFLICAISYYLSSIVNEKLL